MGTIIRHDITWAYAVYAYLDPAYTSPGPARRVKITKDAAYELLKLAGGLHGRFRQDVLYLDLPPAGSHTVSTSTGSSSATTEHNTPPNIPTAETGGEG